MKPPLSYKVLLITSLLPILLWPFVFYLSVFLFDDPNANPYLINLIFYGINAYPLYLVGNAFLSYKIYNKKKSISIGLLFWPLILFGVFFIWISFN